MLFFFSLKTSLPAVVGWLPPLLENVRSRDNRCFRRSDVPEQRLVVWETVVVVTIIIRMVRCIHYPGLTEYLDDYPALSKYYAKSASPYLQQWWDKRYELHWLLSLRFEDVGTLEVNGICPTQLHAKGRNKFRARGIFEHIPGQSSFFKGTDSVL